MCLSPSPFPDPQATAAGAVILGLVMIAGGWGDHTDGLLIGGSILIASVVISAALREPEPPV